jgi:hypothetical protein
MGNREEALRRIFDATGVGTRLTDDQKRELLAHLEDSVEKKVGAGVPEIDAVGQAFSELGDLKKIARQFPDKPALATPEGLVLDRWFPGAGWTAFALFVFFIFIEITIIPGFAQVFQKARVPIPGLTIMFVNLSQVMRGSWPVTAAFALALGAALWLSRRSGFLGKAAHVGFFLFAATLCAAVVVATCLPLLSLLEGIGRR